MQIGLVGLGKMGRPMAMRLKNAGHELWGWDAVEGTRAVAANDGLNIAAGIEDLCAKSGAPQLVWLMTPPGAKTAEAIDAVAVHLAKGATLVDGGNSDFRDTIRRREELNAAGINFIDAGVSGGVEGARDGCGLLIGSDRETYEALSPVFEALAAPGAIAHAGAVGAGHFAKAVHNGMQYALLEAYAEGFELLSASELGIDVLSVFEAYQAGCSIRSYLLEKVIASLQPNPRLEGVEDRVEDSGMGRWTLEEAIRLRVPTPAIAAALHARFRSQQAASPAMKCIAAMRGALGGHAVPGGASK